MAINGNNKPAGNSLAAISLIALMLVSMVVFFYLKKLNDKLESLAQDVSVIKHDTAYSFPTKEIFRVAVTDSIENYVLSQQQKEIDSRYKAYSLAPEQDVDNRAIYGSESARFTLVEFTDLECPYCKKFWDTPKKIADQSNGLVNVQLVHMPLSFHNPAALAGAHASECVAEQKGNRGRWVFMDGFFKNTRGGGQGVPSLTNLAKDVGADVNDFTICMKDGRYLARINEGVSLANKMGINSTPATVIVDNKSGRSHTIKGAIPAATILAGITQLQDKG